MRVGPSVEIQPASETTILQMRRTLQVPGDYQGMLVVPGVAIIDGIGERRRTQNGIARGPFVLPETLRAFGVEGSLAVGGTTLVLDGAERELLFVGVGSPAWDTRGELRDSLRVLSIGLHSLSMSLTDRRFDEVSDRRVRAALACSNS